MTAPNPRASFVGLLLVAVAANLGLGCSSGGHGTQIYPDAVATGTGGNVDGGAVTDRGTGGTVGTGGTIGTGGAIGPTDASSGNTDGPVVPGALQLLPGPALLVGPGGVSCSRAATPAGGSKPDQWCGVIGLGATNPLTVFNLTKALAGTPLTCTGGDPNCFQVSANLAGDFAMGTGDATHGFYGDTLIYYEAATVFAWRPGWSAGRVILARDLTAHCVGGQDAPTAICLKATPDATIINLYAGRLDTRQDPRLPLVEAISASVGNVSFSPDSQSVLWSTATATGPETLKIQTIGDATTRRTVATNVTGWSLTPDGLRWLWLSQPVVSTTLPTTGTLQSAPFPAGTPASNIQALTFNYAPWSATSMVVLANPGTVGADLRAIADINNPTTSARTLATQTAIGLQDVTPGGNILFLDRFDQTNNLINLRAVKADGTGACAVTTLPNADPSASFTSSSMGVEWFRVTVAATGTASAQAVVTTLADCVPHSFSTSPFGFLDVTAGLILQENYNATAFTASMSFLPFAANGTPGSALVIHPAADLPLMALFPDTPRVLYTVNSPSYPNGVYVSGALGGTTLPFMPDTQQVMALPISTGVSSARAMLGTGRTSDMGTLEGGPVEQSSPGARDYDVSLGRSFSPNGRSLRALSPTIMGSRLGRLYGP